MNRLNTWVLGATGYVGSSVMRSLFKHPQTGELITPVVHKSLPPPDFEQCNVLTGALENFEFEWLEKFPPSTFIHAARIAGATPLLRGFAAKKGEKANKVWFNELSKLATPPKVIYVSGTLMYGNLPKNQMAAENHPLNPVAFAKHYAYAERPFENAHNHLDVRMVRPAWILGPNSWFEIFFYKPAIKKGFVPIYGNGQQLMSLIHIDDCGGLILHAARNGTPGLSYNIFAAPPIHQIEFSNIVAEKMGLKTSFVTGSAVPNEASAALTSNIPVATLHKGWWSEFDFQYPTVELMVCDVLARLKAKRT
jgi:nucleoside-diphosphate-sugar epimerase